MRLILKSLCFAVFSVGFLASGGSYAQSPVSRPSPAKTNIQRSNQQTKELNVEFPTVDGWTRSEIVRYPDARLGYSVHYDSDDAGRVTVYVYNLGLTKISSDAESETIKNEIERAKAEIYAVGRMGHYQNIKELKSEIVALGAPPTSKLKARHALFNFSSNGKEVTSEIYLLGHRNHFIKVRATYPKTEDEGENKALTELLMELEKTLTDES